MDFDDLLTDADYSLILTEKLQITHFKILSAKWSPLSDKVEGYMGEHYVLTLSYILDDHTHSERFFIKTKPRSNLSQLKVAETLNCFYKESYMYSRIFKKFEKMGYGTTFAPRCYLAKNNETLVLEDMREKGFVMVKETFLRMDQCEAALRAVAMFHANSLAFEESKSQELGRAYRVDEEDPEAFKEIFYHPSRQSKGLEYDRSTINCLIELSKLLPETEEWKANFFSKINNYDASKVFQIDIPYRKTCGHGDLWANNLLFKEAGSQIDCVLVDFQVTRHHHPAVDALMVLYLTTSSSFRRKYKSTLLDYHYQQMGLILASYGFELEKILPKGDYLDAAKVYESVALFQGAGNRSVTVLPSEVTTRLVRSSGEEFNDLLFSHLRSRVAVEAFKSDESYRKIMSDDIYDLNALL